MCFFSFSNKVPSPAYCSTRKMYPPSSNTQYSLFTFGWSQFAKIRISLRSWSPSSRFRIWFLLSTFSAYTVPVFLLVTWL